MNDGKYIIQKVRGHEVAILFHPLINHCDIGTCKKSRISAGFFRVEDAGVIKKDIEVFAFGMSESLKLHSRGDTDAALIKKVLERN